jgi:hypothetical protein
VVRRIVGYRRFEGLEAAAGLARLYATVRLFVNFFQPSFKLAEKARDGAKVKKRYHPAAKPFQRLMADARVAADIKDHARAFAVSGVTATCCGPRADYDRRRRWRHCRLRYRSRMLRTSVR